LADAIAAVEFHPDLVRLAELRVLRQRLGDAREQLQGLVKADADAESKVLQEKEALFPSVEAALESLKDAEEWNAASAAIKKDMSRGPSMTRRSRSPREAKALMAFIAICGTQRDQLEVTSVENLVAKEADFTFAKLTSQVQMTTKKEVFFPLRVRLLQEVVEDCEVDEGGDNENANFWAKLLVLSVLMNKANQVLKRRCALNYGKEDINTLRAHVEAGEKEEAVLAKEVNTLVRDAVMVDPESTADDQVKVVTTLMALLRVADYQS